MGAQKNYLNIFLLIIFSVCFGRLKKSLIETVLSSFGREIRGVFFVRSLN